MEPRRNVKAAKRNQFFIGYFINSVYCLKWDSINPALEQLLDVKNLMVAGGTTCLLVGTVQPGIDEFSKLANQNGI